MRGPAPGRRIFSSQPLSCSSLLWHLYQALCHAALPFLASSVRLIPRFVTSWPEAYNATPPASSEKYLLRIEIDSAIDSFVCHCEYPIGYAAIPPRKAGLLRHPRNIACACGTPMSMIVVTPNKIPPNPTFQKGGVGGDSNQ